MKVHINILYKLVYDIIILYIFYIIILYILSLYNLYKNNIKMNRRRTSSSHPKQLLPSIPLNFSPGTGGTHLRQPQPLNSVRRPVTCLPLHRLEPHFGLLDFHNRTFSLEHEIPGIFRTAQTRPGTLQYFTGIFVEPLQVAFASRQERTLLVLEEYGRREL